MAELNYSSLVLTSLHWLPVKSQVQLNKIPLTYNPLQPLAP